VRPWRR